MELTIEQKEAVRAVTSLAVTAGAGTGKTRMLAERYLFHLQEQSLSPLQIVAITFTKLAANELRSRIRKTVIEQFPDRPEREDLIAELEAAQISTIHALCSRICREHPEASGAPHQFEVIEESHGGIITNEWLSEALDSMPEEVYDDIPFSLLKEILNSLLKDPVTAKEALKHGPEEWMEASAKALSDLRDDLISWPEYILALETARKYQGQSDDRMEINRQTALEASTLVETGSDGLIRGIKLLSEMKFNAGSRKRWPDGGFAEVKSTLTALRDRAKNQVCYAAELIFRPLDEQFAAMMPALRSAFEHASEHIRGSKTRARLLDYNDLEVCALRALEKESIRQYYQTRWKAFLVDEFQDTNPVQARILDYLTGGSLLTIVGDEKQSIYGFRRAEVEVFRRLKLQIEEGNGLHSELSVSFRTHAELIGKFNSMFGPLLDRLHQPLSSHRDNAPHGGPHVRLYAVKSEGGPGKNDLRRTEARKIADLIKEMIENRMMIYDAELKAPRPVGPGDIAILSRAWDPLDVYAEALSSAGIPTVHMGGGNLLGTREAADAIMLLRFLADPTDDLALVAVLRSPFFAVSDRALFDCAQSTDQRSTWWDLIHAASGFERPAAVLEELVEKRSTMNPGRLLQLADRLTGYSAVIANLRNSMRRQADWSGMLDFIRSIEASCGDDLFATVRRLREYDEIEVERPKIEARDAVSLMTIHGAKGLEWPVVIVPDLARNRPNDPSRIFFDQHRGIGIKLNDEDGEPEKTMLFSLLQMEQRRRDDAEARRLLYVAITRARDAVTLTATDEKGGYLDFLLEGLNAAGIGIERIEHDPQDGLPFEQPAAKHQPAVHRMMTDPVRIGMRDIPVSALTDYARCPAMFRFRHVDNHPGLGVGSDNARRIGSLTHKALELGIDQIDGLAGLDRTLERSLVGEALDLARRFRTAPVYEQFRSGDLKREGKVRIEVSNLTLHGSIDLLGDDFVLDYKTDRLMAPEVHRFQLWAYAKAAGRDKAHIAYLRHDRVHTFDQSDLAKAGSEIDEMCANIVAGQFEATPSIQTCQICPFAEICADKFK